MTTVVIPDQALENLKDAVDIFCEKADTKALQPKFMEYLLAGDPKEIAAIALRNYKEFIIKNL